MMDSIEREKIKTMRSLFFKATKRDIDKSCQTADFRLTLKVLSNENSGGSKLLLTIHFDKLLVGKCPKWAPSREEYTVNVLHVLSMLPPSEPVGILGIF